MGADVSRVRFDPLRDYAGVVLQQGRLLLDADFNELVALLDRRLRAETCDLTSPGPDPQHAGVAWVPRQTPDAFRVTAAGGKLTIGRGRMYVDGLLAENHGEGPYAFDALLSEQVGTVDTPYEAQPYWPSPDALPAGGPHLAYLDVWERELTYLEQPDLVEVAVGVDTTARRQTAWQVRLLPNVGNETCDSDDDAISGWLDVIAPSAGRLTTGTVPVAAADDPCALPPSGGFRGLENQTYRVEIHDGGAPGTATFKWSRDNGSVATPVVEMVSPTVLRIATVGRDDVLRVSTGDWVEILDDRYELTRTPGVVRKVTVDDAARTISFTGALPTDLRPASADDAAARHLRVRRWDQAGVVRDGGGAQLVDLDAPGASGVVTVPAAAATQVQLESGVVVSFSVVGAGGRFRAGDHWIFAARTADTSLEELTAAPPLGIHHHYARLGVVTFPDGETDCRRLWPPEAAGAGCECTVCVTPGTAPSLQTAVDHVKDTGGTICLGPGVYDLGDGVTIDGARALRIRGQGLATILVARGTALTVTRSAAVTVENLAIVSGIAAPAAIRLRTVVDTTLQDLAVLSYAVEERGGSAVELSGIAALVAVRRNVLVGRTALDGAGGLEKEPGVLAVGLRIEDNVLVGRERGVDLGGLSAYLAGTGGAIRATGAVAPGGSLAVHDNSIATIGAGIAVGADAVVDGNVVNRLGANGTDGIVVERGSIAVAAGHVRITGNRVHDRTATGIALRTAVRSWTVKQNVVTSVGSGISVERRGAAEHAAVEDNEVYDVAVQEGVSGGAFGIALANATATAVLGNTVARVGTGLAEARARAAIAVTACADVQLGGNVVRDIGPAGGFLGLSAGMLVVGPFERLVVATNSSRFGPDDAVPSEGEWHALLVRSAGAGEASLGAGKAVIPAGTLAVAFTGQWAFVAARRGEHVTVTANALAGGGRRPTCLVQVAGDIVADANQCAHFGEGSPGMVLQTESSIAASSNRVRGPKSRLVLQVPQDRFAAVGNLASAGTQLGSGPLPAPWQALNPVVS
jgi:hypothetical protein